MTEKAHQRDFQGALDAFVTVLDPMGGPLYSTYLGGGADDLGNAIAVDQDCAFPNCQVYVAGNTASAAFPVANPLQGTYNGGSSDAFVSKLDFQMLDTGNVLTYSTYFGGPGMDIGNDIAVDAQCISNCDVYITGSTDSQVFPIANAWQALFGGGPSDAFVAKLNADGSLAYSTYVGGQGADSGRGIAVDGGVPGFGNAFVTGWSDDAGSFLGVPFLGASGSSIDAFVVKLDATGRWVYGTSFGGSGEDRGSAIALEPDCQFDCDAYVAGVTRPGIGVPPDFPTVHPVQPAFGGGASDAFVVRVNGAGNDLIYSTYLGGSGDELNLGDAFSVGPSIAVDIDGNAYIAGFTLSTDFPTVNPLKPFNAGSNDAFVAKLDASGPPVADAGPDQEVPAPSNMGADVTLDGTGSTDPDGDPLAYSWTGPFGGALHGATPTLSFAPGTYTLTLTVHDGRDGTDTDTVDITVLANMDPVADAGPDQTVTCTVQQGDAEECLVQLDGSGSSDPDDDPLSLTYSWDLMLGDGLRTATGVVTDMSVPAGTHNVISLTVDDGRGGTAFDTVDVGVIVDVNHPPVGAPHLLEQILECSDPDGADVTLDASGFLDPDSDQLTYFWVVEFEESVVHAATAVTSVVSLPLGAYQVTLTVDDGRGGVVIDGGLVEIQADKPPTLSLYLSPDTINANNHKMVAITAMITVADACDADAPGVELLSITSSDPDNGTGDADTPNDIHVGTDDREFSVRAERVGSGGDRVYTVTYEATDALGNATKASATVTVPHDQSGS